MTKETKAEKEAGERQMLQTLEKELSREEKHIDRLNNPKGTVAGKAYYVLKAPHYRDAVLYPAGTVVCVEDERPSKTWVRVKPVKGAKELARPKAAPSEPDFGADEDGEEIVPLVVDKASPNPGGVSPSLMHPATQAVTVTTTVDEVKGALKGAEKDKAEKERPHDKKL
jgi:hypothetical protein